MNKKEIEAYFKVNGGDFLIKKNNKNCFLLLHGLAPKPNIFNNFIDLVKEDKDLDFDVYAPQQRFALNNISKKSDYKSWIKDGAYYFNKLDSYYDNVYVIGHSLGGALALNLSYKLKLKNLILLSAPIKVDFRILFSSCTKFMKIPFFLKWNSFKLFLKNNSIINKINSDILYCVGLNDKTITLNSPKTLIKKTLKSNYIHVEYIPNCDHTQILRDKNICKEVLSEIKDFLN